MLLLFSSALLLGGCAAPAAGGTDKDSPQDTRTAVTLEDTSEVLLNPGKGYMHYGDPDYQRLKERMYLVGTGYHRFNWCDIETADNVFDFGKIDDWIATYKKFGRPFGFGVMAVNTSSSKQYITPRFVFDEGAKHFLHTDGGNTQVIPDWSDEIFLRQVSELAAALGERYN